MVVFAMAILIPFYLVCCMTVMVEGIHCSDIAYVRPPSSALPVIQKQISIAKKSATDPDQVLLLFTEHFSYYYSSRRTQNRMSRFYVLGNS